MKKIKIVVVGLGYVGLSNSILLAQKNSVMAVDINVDKVNLINERKSPLADNDIDSFLTNKILDLKATLPNKDVFKKADIVIVATPTNYDETTHFFNTDSVEKTIENVLNLNPKIKIIIRSTIPVGFTDRMIDRYQTNNIYFVPEFIREGKALHDNLYPSRIVVGGYGSSLNAISFLFKKAAKKKDVEILFMNPSDAEASKLFSNTYLAMRVAFFNELDSFARLKELNTKSIIDSIGYDPRIGSHYNNPSFGYGGYCLPKDTKQLLANYKDIPQKLIEAIIISNEVRKDFVAQEVLKLKPKVVGIHRLLMKEGSDNYRESSVQGVIKRLIKKNMRVIIFEPLIKDENFLNSEMICNLESFIELSDVILTNRMSKELMPVKSKVFTCDLYCSD